MKPIIIFACILAATALVAQPPATGKAPNSRPRHPVAVNPDAARAPMLVRWQLLSDNGGRLRISAIVVRKALLRVPIDVQVEVPPGLQLVSGTTTFRLEANLPPGETVATMEFVYSRAPREDLKLTAHATGPGMGVHATDVYRFGRPAPHPPRPQPSGPSNKVGDVDLGPAIEIEKKK
jgi:hypothetical protein